MVLRYRLSSDLQNYFQSRCTVLYVGFYAATTSQKTHPQTMADAMETARNEGIPALPLLPDVVPVVHMPGEVDGQNRQSASDVSLIGASRTPTPPQRILVQASSAVLSITNAATSTATEDDAGDTPKKRNVLKQKFPDFSKSYSEDNPFLSGDESDQWEAEEENIAAQVADGNALKELAALELSDPVEEVTELDYLLEM